MSNIKKIRQLNDQLRQTLHGGIITLTKGILNLGEDKITVLLYQMQCYDDFSPDNDPHCEHDFGAIKYDGSTFFWKIDYYDLDCQMHSPDPSNRKVTRRVLTLMLAEEY